MWARIENGNVCEITDVDPDGRFHPSLHWVTCDSEVDQGWVWDEGSFNFPINEHIVIIHVARTAEINRACEAAITAGFSSGALGTPHYYTSQLDDQLNLNGAVLRGLDTLYPCRDEQGNKAFRMHTAGQLQQVGDEFTLHKLQLLKRANELKQQLDNALAAGSAEAMQVVIWDGDIS